MTKAAKVKIILVSLILALAGCQHMPTPSIVIKPSKAEVALEKLVNEKEKENKKLAAQIIAAENKYKAEFDANISLGSASIWAVYDTMLADPEKDRFDLAEMLGLEVAIKALPEPSIADYKKTSETQRKLISEQAALIEKGKKEIEEQKAIAIASKAAQEAALKEKAAIEAKKAEDEAAFQEKKAALEAQVIEQKNAVIAESAKREKEAQDKKDLQVLIVRILMVVGVLAAVAAFITKSPVIGLCSAAFIGLAIGVSFLPIGYIIGGLVLVFGTIAFVAISKYTERDRALGHVVGATQEYKVENPDLFKNGLSKNLQEWTKDDSKAVQLIENKLKELNLK